MGAVDFKSNEMHQDYDAAIYFDAIGARNVKFTTKVVTVEEKPTLLITVRATMPDGRIAEIAMWPRNEATEEDLKVTNLEDFEFRVGFFTDESTGEVTTGAPKHLLCHGEKRTYNR